MLLSTTDHMETMTNVFDLDNAIKATKIYFNEEHHRYTDEFGNLFTSMTTILKEYFVEFDAKNVAIACERIGANPRHKNYLKYKGKKAWQIEAEWKATGRIAAENGTVKHGVLELAVKDSNGFNDKVKTVKVFDDVKLTTINETIQDHSYGRIDLDILGKTGIEKRYPKLYKMFKHFTDKGFHIYSELAVYDCERLVSGLIDIILINFDTNEFLIVDWKTNKQPIRFDAGYYEKDIKGNDTDIWIPKNDVCRPPISNLASSIGNHYAMQLSGYANLVELRDLTCIGILLYQIREPLIPGELERVDGIQINYLKEYAEMMFNDHWNKHKKELKIQTNLFS